MLVGALKIVLPHAPPKSGHRFKAAGALPLLRTMHPSIDDANAELQDRINAYNLERKRDAAERLYRNWSELDPKQELLALLVRSSDRVWRKAIEVEAERPGQGKMYVAGAIERATGKEIKAADIVAGRHRKNSM